MKKIGFMTVLFTMFCVPVMAAAAGPDYMSADFWLKVLSGAGLGLFTVFVGWAKKQDPGMFDWKGLTVRVPVGLAVGITAAVKEIPYDDAYAWAAGVGVIMLADNLSKIFMRKIWPDTAEEKKLRKEKKEKELKGMIEEKE